MDVESKPTTNQFAELKTESKVKHTHYRFNITRRLPHYIFIEDEDVANFLSRN